MKDTLFKIIYSAAVMAIGVALARFVVADPENIQAAVSGLVLVQFIQAASGVWAKR